MSGTMKYVLFSPVGSKDPMAPDNEQKSYWDGSMVHICRKYRPEHIVLYFSKEMLEKEPACRKCIDLLYKHLGTEAGDGLLKAVKTDLEEVQKFDQYYKEFPKLLDELHQNFPEHTLLLNVSSGAPAMKSALVQLGYFSSFKKVVPVQVKSPNKSSNHISEASYSEEDLETAWELNSDNDPDLHEDRCEEVDYPNYNFLVRCKDIKILLDSYDYEAAFKVAEEIKELLPPRAFELLDAARHRVQLNWGDVKPCLQKDLGLLPDNARKNGRDLAEYLLWLQMKQKRDDRADFLRGLTPALFYLLKIAVEEKMGCRLDNYCTGDEDNRILDPQKLMRDEEGQALQNILQLNAPAPVSSNHYAKILEKRERTNPPWRNPLLRLREIEKFVRNKLAHQITAADEESILCVQRKAIKNKKHRAKFLREPLDSAEMMELVWDAFQTLNSDTKGNERSEVSRAAYKEIYKEMNEKITAAMEDMNG